MTTTTYIGGVPSFLDFWSNAAVWDNGVPVAGVDAVIPDNTTANFKFDSGIGGGALACATLTVGTDNLLANNDAVSLTATTVTVNGTTLDLSNNMVINAALTLDGGATLTAATDDPLDVDSITLDGGSVLQVDTAQPCISALDVISGTLTSLDGTHAVFSGTVRIRSGGTVTVSIIDEGSDASWTIDSGATLPVFAEVFNCTDLTATNVASSRFDSCDIAALGDVTLLNNTAADIELGFTITSCVDFLSTGYSLTGALDASGSVTAAPGTNPTPAVTAFTNAGTVMDAVGMTDGGTTSGVVFIAFTWLGGDSGWNDAANWAGGSVPTASDDVIFNGTAVPGAAKCIPTSDAECKTISGDGIVAMQMSGVLTVHGDCDLGAIVMDALNSGGLLNVVTGTLTCAGQMTTLIDLYVGDVGESSQVVTFADAMVCHIFHTYPNCTVHSGGFSQATHTYETQSGALIDGLGPGGITVEGAYSLVCDMLCEPGQTWTLDVDGSVNLVSGTVSGSNATASTIPLDASASPSVLDGGGNSGWIFAGAPTTYDLTVTNGSGSGSYEEADVVPIVADAPATGYAFDAWTGDTAGIADVNAASTTITMPAADAAITATYVLIDYTLTVVTGTGGGPYNYGDVVPISGTSPGGGYTFTGWTSAGGGSFGNAALETTTFTMPASSVTITAHYTLASSKRPEAVLAIRIGVGS